jgi:hypothetical protein
MKYITILYFLLLYRPAFGEDKIGSGKGLGLAVVKQTCLEKYNITGSNSDIFHSDYLEYDYAMFLGYSKFKGSNSTAKDANNIAI